MASVGVSITFTVDFQRLQPLLLQIQPSPAMNCDGKQSILPFVARKVLAFTNQWLQAGMHMHGRVSFIYIYIYVCVCTYINLHIKIRAIYIQHHITILNDYYK